MQTDRRDTAALKLRREGNLPTTGGAFSIPLKTFPEFYYRTARYCHRKLSVCPSVTLIYVYDVGFLGK